MDTPRSRSVSDLPRWVPLAAIALAVPQLVVGAWAVVSPASWYEDFPGVDPRLVAAEPPYNQHLATDAGAGFLAVGVGLLVAGIVARRTGVIVALAAFLTHAVAHIAYHATNPSELLSGGEDVTNVLVQALPIVAAGVLLVLTVRSESSPSTPVRGIGEAGAGAGAGSTSP